MTCWLTTSRGLIPRQSQCAWAAEHPGETEYASFASDSLRSPNTRPDHTNLAVERYLGTGQHTKFRCERCISRQLRHWGLESFTWKLAELLRAVEDPW